LSSADVSRDEELFGNPAKIALMKRSRHLWSLLWDNPRFAYYGRSVLLADPRSDTADVLCSLARLQGATVCFYYPASEASALFAELKSRGW
jgi:type IV secretory pathway TraG/TraD family ATPase VirD4